MNRTLLFQFGVAVLVFVGALALVVVVSLSAIQVREKASLLEQEVVAKQGEVLRVASAKAALPVLARSEETLRTYRTRSSDIVPFLERLEKQGGAEGAVVEVLSVSPEQAGTQGRIAISLTVRGTFDAVVRTVGSIEYGPYDIIVKTTALDNPAGTDEKTSAWTAAITLSLGTDQGKLK